MDLSARTPDTKISFFTQIFRPGLGAFPATGWQSLLLLFCVLCSMRWWWREGADTFSSQSGHRRIRKFWQFRACTFLKCPFRLASFNCVARNLPEGRIGQRGQSTIFKKWSVWTSCQLIPYSSMYLPDWEAVVVPVDAFPQYSSLTFLVVSTL